MKTLTTTLITVVAIAAAVLIFSAPLTAMAKDSEPKEHEVEIRNLQFIPNELTVAPGDTITWTNYDFVPHTVTADNKSWESDLINANEKWQTVVTADMYKTYFCRFHPNMKAELIIVQ